MYHASSDSPVTEQARLIAGAGGAGDGTRQGMIEGAKGSAIKAYLVAYAQDQADQMNTTLEMKKAVRNIQATGIDMTQQVVTGTIVLLVAYLVIRKS